MERQKLCKKCYAFIGESETFCLLCIEEGFMSGEEKERIADFLYYLFRLVKEDLKKK
jgi:hypothetical protein